MIKYNNKTWLTTREACLRLNKSMEALRQMIYRKRINTYRVGNRIYIDREEVANLHPKKTGLPAFEKLNSSKMDEFYSIEQVSRDLGFGVGYVKTLIKKKELEGYCTVDGQILITRQSFDKFLGVFNEAKYL